MYQTIISQKNQKKQGRKTLPNQLYCVYNKNLKIAEEV